jgi:meiotic recombination protein SPO11
LASAFEWLFNIMSLATALVLNEEQALVRSYIDSVLIDLLNQLSLFPSEGQPSITLRCQPRAETCVVNPRNGALEAGRNDDAYRSYSWPGRTAHESWKFST